MTVGALLSRLNGSKQTGAGRWIAVCPAHDDRRPSLSIAESSAGVVLINCFGGCGAADVLAAVGLDFSDLYPENSGEWESRNKAPRRERATFSAADVLRLIAEDALDVAVIASDLAADKTTLTPELRNRLWDAAGRISTGLEATHAVR